MKVMVSIEQQEQRQARVRPAEAKEEIIFLANSVYYFLQFVFIVVEESCFRLVVLHDNRVLTYRRYNTLRGAKIAFSKFYEDKAWEDNIKAQWTPSYPPDGAWLEDKLKQTKGH